MNKSTTIVFLTLLAAFATDTKAQIQVSSDDVYRKGTYQMALDMSGGFDAGTPGPNKIWDFTNLKNQTTFGFSIISYYGNGNGNEANLVKVDGTDTFEFVLKSGNELFTVFPFQDFDKVTYKKERTFSFPLGYNSTNIDSTIEVLEKAGIEFGIPAYDSIRLSFTMVTETSVDAWGILKLPMSDYDALRVKTDTRISVRMMGKKGAAPYTPVPSFEEDEQMVDYHWLTKGKGHYIAYYNTGDSEMSYIISSVLSTESVQENKDIVFSNPAGNEMKMTNRSQQPYRISLYDMNGRLLLSEEMEGHEVKTIDTRDLPQGIYSLEILNLETKVPVFEKLLK